MQITDMGVSIQGLGLVPADFEDCDLAILDGLDIRGWSEFKRCLEGWGIGAHSIPTYRCSVRHMSLGMSQWVQIVETYSKCALTFSEDKLVAISGLAQTLSKGMDCDYLAGLWRQDLEHQLLWCIYPPCSTPAKDNTRGPSWSWAAIDSQVHFGSWEGVPNSL